MSNLEHTRTTLLSVADYTASTTFINSIGWKKDKRADILTNAKTTETKVCVVVGVVTADRLACGPVGGYAVDSKFPQQLEKARYSLFLRKPVENTKFSEDYDTTITNTIAMMKDIAISDDHRYFHEKVGRDVLLKLSSPVFVEKVKSVIFNKPSNANRF